MFDGALLTEVVFTFCDNRPLEIIPTNNALKTVLKERLGKQGSGAPKTDLERKLLLI